jgi:hypothetical protein
MMLFKNTLKVLLKGSNCRGVQINTCFKYITQRKMLTGDKGSGVATKFSGLTSCGQIKNYFVNFC